MADNKSKKASKKKSGITIQIVLCIAALAAIAFMTVRICRLGIIPLRMYATLAAVLTVAVIAAFVAGIIRFHRTGYVCTVIVAAVAIMLMIFSNNTAAVISGGSGVSKQKDTFSVLVLMENDAKALSSTYSFIYGYNESTDVSLTDRAVIEITKDAQFRPALKGYETVKDTVDALLSGKVGAIIFNEAFRPVMQKVYPEFNTRTRILNSYELESDISAWTAPKDNSVFSFYVAAAKSADDIETFGESEVNKVVTVDMNAKKAVVTTIPSQYLVNIKTDGTGGREPIAYLMLGNYNYIPQALKDITGTDVNYFVACHVKDPENIDFTKLAFGEHVKYCSNMPYDVLASLIRTEGFDSDGWEIEWKALDGTSSTITTEVFGISGTKVIVPDNEG